MTFTTNPSVEESLVRLAGMNLEGCARILGARYDDGSLLIPLFDRNYAVTPRGISDDQGRSPTEAMAKVLCRYIIDHPASAPDDGPRVTFRELDGAGPLVSRFADNTNTLIAKTFGTRLPDLEAAARDIGGRPIPQESGFDLSVRFDALPRVPVYLQFNAADDLFPAQAALLFHQTAQTWLDMGSLFTLGTYLSGRLIGSA